MKQDRQQLIDDLVAELRPVRRPGRIGAQVAVWLAIAVVCSVVLTRATGPLRPGAIHNLVEYPLFALETVVAMLAIGAMAFAGMRSAIPAGRDAMRRLWWVLLPLGAWLAFHVVDFWHPAHPVSTLGDRRVCIWQVLLFSLPSLGLMLWLARRQFPLRPRFTGALAGGAAAGIPALLMQFACMYEPSHILTYHLGPMVLTAALGAVVGPLLLKLPSMPPRRRRGRLH